MIKTAIATLLLSLSSCSQAFEEKEEIVDFSKYERANLNILKKASDGQPFSYTTCRYIDHDQLEGLVVFLFFHDSNYRVEVNLDNLQPINIVTFHGSGDNIILGPHSGSNGASPLIRNFIKANQVVINDPEPHLAEVFEWMDLDLSNPVTCAPPEI